MAKCNRERIKEFTSEFAVSSDADAYIGCEQNLANADMLDFEAEMDNLSFYEKTKWNKCEDLIYVANEKALWQCIVGEVKTPRGALSNSVGQSNYGCDIWNTLGENLTSLDIKEIENEVIRVCLKYPEVHNVIGIESYFADVNKSLLIKITLDTIYGVYGGELHIPTAHISNKNWKLINEKYFN